MQTDSITYKIQELIARDKMLRAIQLMIIEARKWELDCLNEAILLSNQASALRTAIIQGRIKWEEESIAKRKLAHQILMFLSDFIYEYNEANEQDKKKRVLRLNRA